jgi:CHASE1-domain containing sensor protein
MFYQIYKKERRAAAVIALGVLLAVLLAACGVHLVQTERERAEFDAGRVEAARQYAFLVQRELDAHAAAGLGLAAHVGASGTLDNTGLAAYVRAARYLDRLKGLRAFGYLPRVAPEMAHSLEDSVQGSLPGYRIRQRRVRADYYYPMLYLLAPDPARAAALRGLDYSAFPERLAAIRKAESTGAPAASAVHAALHDPARRPVVLTFTPVRTRERQYDHGVGSAVVVSVMRVADLFEAAGDGLDTSRFALVVDENDEGRWKPVYRARQAGSAAGTPIYSGTLRYADRNWRLRMFSVE